MATHREVEDKYDVDDDAVLPVLTDLKRVRAVETVSHELEATYFDTADLTLISAGITLRRRTGDHDEGWHLKLPAGQARHEIQLPLSRAKSIVPKQLRDLVRLHTRDADLVAVVRLCTHRTEHRLLGKGGDELATVCDDVVTAETEGCTRSWREWEVESTDGDLALLGAAGRLVRAAGARPSGSRSKLARALTDRLPETREPAAKLRPKDPARLLVHPRVAELVDELHGRDPGVRADVPDGVHKMRVATRRLRSNLATYRPVLDRDVTDLLRDEVAWLGQVLGTVRDCEVQRDHLASALSGLAAVDATLVRGPVSARLRRHARTTHHAARVVAREALDSARYLDLMDQLTRLASDPPWTARAERSIRRVLLPEVRRDWRRLEQQVAAFLDGGGTSDTLVHDVRKAAKRTTYGAEPLVPVYGRPAKGLVAATKQIQAVLGDHQDTVTARRHLLDLADAATATGEDAFTYGLLHARERERAAELQAEFLRFWDQLPRTRLRQWLDQA